MQACYNRGVFYIPIKMALNTKNTKVLESLFERPDRSDIRWHDLEKLILALGGKVSESSGSRVRFFLNDEVATFHRPHPSPCVRKATLKDLREFFKGANITPGTIGDKYHVYL